MEKHHPEKCTCISKNLVKIGLQTNFSDKFRLCGHKPTFVSFHICAFSFTTAMAFALRVRSFGYLCWFAAI